MKKNNPRQNLGGNLADGVEITAREYRNNAPNDKSYFTTICGVNQKFTEEVTEYDINNKLNKFNIPETVEEGDNNYYTFKLNNEYYCKQQTGNFMLYDRIMVYLPNGDWSRMYFDYSPDSANFSGGNQGSGDIIDLPQIIEAVEEPGGDNPAENDLWIVLNNEDAKTFDDITEDNFVAIYTFESVEDDETVMWRKHNCAVSHPSPSHMNENDYWIGTNLDGESQRIYQYVYVTNPTTHTKSLVWREIYPENEYGDVPQLYIDTLSPMKENDYWLDIDSEEDRNIEGRYQYRYDEETKSYKWVLMYKVEANTGGVGRNVGRHNEVFNINPDESQNNTITTQYGDYNTARGYNNSISGESMYYADVSGSNNTLSATGNNVKLGGIVNTISGYVYNSEMNGYRNTATSSINNSYISGLGNQVLNQLFNSVVVGEVNVFPSNAGYCESSIIFGYDNSIEGVRRSAVGGSHNRVVDAVDAVVVGNGTYSYIAMYSILTGQQHSVNTANNSVICGTQHGISSVINAMVCGEGHSISGITNAVVCGQGATDASGKYIVAGNVFYVTSSGAVAAAGGYGSIGADYAETYEWQDGNPNNEDRRGLFVTTDGEYIKLTNGTDDYILGVVSATPSICGDTYDLHWKGKYKTDVFGKILLDDNGDPIISDEYNPDKKYIPQSERPEKSQVGTIGKMIVIDDGTCIVNKYCKPSVNGIGTHTDDKNYYRVIKRIDETHVKIILK